MGKEDKPDEDSSPDSVHRLGCYESVRSFAQQGLKSPGWSGLIVDWQ